MTVSILQNRLIRQHNTATTNSVTHTLASTATAGSKILLGGFIDKATTATPPTGFSNLIARNNTSISFFLFWKVADGTELNLAVSYGDSTSNTTKTFSYVFSADADIDVYSYAPNPHSETAVRSVTAATTGALGANPYIAIAAVGTDSNAGITAGTNHRVDNDYSIVETNYTDSSPGGIPAIAIAEKTSLFDTSGEFLTFQYDGGTTDQMAIMLAVIRDTNPSAPSGGQGKLLGLLRNSRLAA